MPKYPNLKVFSGSRCQGLTNWVCNHLGIPVGMSETSVFPDGEVLVKLNEDVRGRDCFIVLSTCDPVNDNLMELLVYCDCLRRASARQIIAVIPYFGYARQDRKDEGRVPITAKLVANMIVTAGATRVLAVDLHAAQIQGFFDIPVDHISASPIFLDYFETRRAEFGNLCLVSPDVGNVKVAEKMANLLSGELAIIHKKRVNGSEVSSRHLIGDVEGRTVLMFDDMISTAGTICEAAKFVVSKGAKRVIAAATHAVFVGPAFMRLSDSPIDEIICTDTVSRSERLHADLSFSLQGRYQELSIASLIGNAIERIHSNKSVSALLERTAGSKR